jgi:hypothetical protein
MVTTGNNISQHTCETEECIYEIKAQEMIAESLRCNELLDTLTALPLVAHICASLKIELRDRLITFQFLSAHNV